MLMVQGTNQIDERKKMQPIKKDRKCINKEAYKSNFNINNK